MVPRSFSKKISKRHQEISPPGPTVVASDDFANTTRPFADRMVFLVFLGSTFVGKLYLIWKACTYYRCSGHILYI